MATRHHRRRLRNSRGITLLIVVTLLTLFIMIGITLALVASSYKNTASNEARSRTYGDSSEREMDYALAQLLYGTSTTNRTSLTGHSLLEDAYGNDSTTGTVTGVIYPNGNQVAALSVTLASTANTTTPDYYSGRVLTFLSGNARGLSTRILGYDPTGIYHISIEMPESDLPVAVSVAAGDAFLINGAPFNGTGAGYMNEDDSAPMSWGGGSNPMTLNLDARLYIEGFAAAGQPQFPAFVALAPHFAKYPMPQNIAFDNGTNPRPIEIAADIGGLDENWDAPDYQNMFLAMVPAALGQPGGGRQSIVLLPSFHRPDLVQFWFNFLVGPSSPITWGATTTTQQKVQLIKYPYGFNCVYEGPGSDDEQFVSLMEVSKDKRDAIINLKRSIIFRPLREDHPNFTGGNDAFEPDKLTSLDDTFYYLANGGTPAPGATSAPYDVDNDGDGIADSIWIDLGMPVMTAPDGRKYKRLFAFLIQDLDNRLNVNVHGNMETLANANARAATRYNGALAGVDPNGGGNNILLPRGINFGPAEVDFMHIFGAYGNANAEAAYRSVLLGRYGFDGGAALPRPGLVNTDDTLSAVKNIGMPNDHCGPPLTSYSTPPDVWGRGAMALDYYGTPVWIDATNVATGETVDDPYEIHFNPRHSGPDSPYTAADMEGLLRYHDPAAVRTGGSRLFNRFAAQYLAAAGPGLPFTSPGYIGIDNQRRNLLTTISADMPVPAMITPKEHRDPSDVPSQLNNGAGSQTLLDLYANRLSFSTSEFRKIVPFEIRRGQRFNINREFGNGQHDNWPNPSGMPPTILYEDPYGVVDDPGESYRNMDPMNAPNYDPREKVWTGQINFEHENDLAAVDPLNWAAGAVPLVPGYPAYDPAGMPPNFVLRVDTRQIYARQLYCLMMLLRDQDDYYDTDGDGTGTAAETARLLAQLAVNIVDYRDADSINTGFEFDENPWDGWGVDGRLDTTGDQTVGGVVWGVERPEVLLSETMALHDRRTEDLANDDGANGGAATVAGGDESYDQRLKPRDALFIELFNPWFDRGNNLYDHKPPELYAAGGVDLQRVNVFGTPVWRVLVAQGAGIATFDPDATRPEYWASPSNPSPPSNVTVDRSIYFATRAAATGAPFAGAQGPAHGMPFFAAAGVACPPLMPGRYAVLGGADEVTTDANANPPVPVYSTYVGRHTLESELALGGTGLLPTQRRRIELRPNASTNYNDPNAYQVRIYENQRAYNDNSSDPLQNDYDWDQVQPMIALPIMDPRSVSVSEPAAGYPAGIIDPVVADEEAYSPPKDTPLDDGDTALKENTTTPNYRRLYLQRLANPLLPWNELTNPYVTVDASQLDITAFNGVAPRTLDADPNVGMGTRNFQTFQRGGSFRATDPEAVSGYDDSGLMATRGQRNLWTQGPARLAPTAASPTGDPMGVEPHHFPYPLYHTLGCLNRRFWPYFTSAAYMPPPAPPVPPIAQPINDQRYYGAPSFFDIEDGAPTMRTFPWLTHLDRPFTSPMELLNVPCVSPSQLTVKFSMQVPAAPNSLFTAYQFPSPGPTAWPYGHLFNFFQTTTDGTITAQGQNAPNICRIFDYMEVPSPYLGAERYYNPQFFQTSGGGVILLYKPPYSKLSRFRDPGRVNLNTMNDGAVWEGVTKSIPNMDPAVNGAPLLVSLMLSRQGQGSSGATLLHHNPAYPSLFSQPFRTADSADMMPPIPSDPNGLRKRAADASLLRTLSGQASESPIISYDPQPAQVQAHDDPYRNSYFRFQGLQKVANMVTTRSNVFAVWVTVGYFEVEQSTVSVGRPDGYALAQEIGSDSGGIKRHRFFAIIDRSVPVAYEPGKRHNTDKAILLRRYIE